MPWGELAGAESFATLDAIYTGYGENGPSQGALQSRGNDATADFPLLDFVESCEVVEDETLPADWAPYPTDFRHATFRDWEKR